MPPALFFFLRIAPAILGLLWFRIHFSIICSGSVKSVVGNLIWIELNWELALSNISVLTVLILPIQGPVLPFFFNLLQFHLSVFYGPHHVSFTSFPLFPMFQHHFKYTAHTWALLSKEHYQKINLMPELS